MINKLLKITDGLYRGAAPSPEDVKWLKDNLHINKIISLDAAKGHIIDRTCRLFGINHIIMPLDHTRHSLIPLLKRNLKDLLLDNGPTFIHCAAGKDRTGFVTALFQCKYMNKNPEEAIKEAESLGFGTDLDPSFQKMIELYKKIIRSCKPQDENSADIVSNEREYISDNRDSFLDESRPGSFAPYLSKTRQNPIDAVYNYINDQSSTRENYQPIKEYDKEQSQNGENIPQVGVFNNDSGARGFGPTENYGGFFYD